jgi:hypothetical protein
MLISPLVSDIQELLADAHKQLSKRDRGFLYPAARYLESRLSGLSFLLLPLRDNTLKVPADTFFVFVLKYAWHSPIFDFHIKIINAGGTKSK